MQTIQLRHIRTEFGDFTLFDDMQFTVGSGERVGLVGRNGAGKSTLLSYICGERRPDSGSILIAPGEMVCLLRQNPLENLSASHPTASSAPAVTEQEGGSLRYMRLLGLDPERLGDPRVFSGGERTKVALAQIFSENPTVLLLDEPTNHLDYEGTRMLIRLLERFRGTLVIVSHDRFFLDRTVARIAEIEGGHVTEYEGNYSDYREEKERRFSEQMHRYDEDRKEQRRVRELIRTTKSFAEKAHRDSTKRDASGNRAGMKEFKRVKAKKMDKKVKNDTRRLERLMQDGEKRPHEEKKIRFRIDAGPEKGGKRIVEAYDLARGWGERVLFSESSFDIRRGEHVALFGPNGCGKTTLIRMLLGESKPDGGTLRVTSAAVPFFVEQFAGFSEDVTAGEYLLRQVGHLSGEDRALLFLLDLDTRRLGQRLSSLSLGEQMKLRLAVPILEKKDFILLDEPTNHMDLAMREQMEKTLAEYPGTLLIASHDIYLLEKTCDKVLLFEGGKVRRLEESFAEFIAEE